MPKTETTFCPLCGKEVIECNHTLEKKSDTTKYPQWICGPCGDKYGEQKCGIATWHEEKCEICGVITMVTEPRDFGYLKDGWRDGK